MRLLVYTALMVAFAGGCRDAVTKDGDTPPVGDDTDTEQDDLTDTPADDTDTSPPGDDTDGPSDDTDGPGDDTDSDLPGDDTDAPADDTDAPADDTDVQGGDDTDVPPLVYPTSTLIDFTAGGGRVQSTQYHMELSVGQPMMVQERRTQTYVLKVGIGTAFQQ
ncbi:MAG TPA: hypothetical protein PKA64_02475 [Myxococcota bacterium]|nr:hypothetical protein [Myxococcota bacterium]